MKKGEDFQCQLNLLEDKFKGAWKGDGNANGGSNKNSSGITGLLKEKGVEDILVVAGGCILKEDVASLHEAGVDGIFLPGTPTNDIITYIRDHTPGAQLH